MTRNAVIVLAILSLTAISLHVCCQDTVESVEKKETEEAVKIKPKELSDNVKKGLTWLINSQQENGGWAQGEESSHMGGSMTNLKDKPNVADTCMALFALMRSGSTPTDGPYKGNIVKGLGFVCSEVEESDKESLYITSIRGTRAQMKLGTYIDTFLAATILAEAKGKMGDDEGNKRILAALDKTMDKIERNQRDDGTWDNAGWATDISQSMASRALNIAARKGHDVDEAVREKAERFARMQYDQKTGKFTKGPGAAGVELYNGGFALNAMWQSDFTNGELKGDLKKKAQEAESEEEREAAKQTLQRFEENQRDLDNAKKAIVSKIDDKQFIAGFGSNGGEEFLSYLNIGEALAAGGGEEWKKWDESMTKNLNHIQNSDGSWTGHHCITGRTFCTSASLLVLMVDRAETSLGGEIKRH